MWSTCYSRSSPGVAPGGFSGGLGRPVSQSFNWPRSQQDVSIGSDIPLRCSLLRVGWLLYLGRDRLLESLFISAADIDELEGQRLQGKAEALATALNDRMAAT